MYEWSCHPLRTSGDPDPSPLQDDCTPQIEGDTRKTMRHSVTTAFMILAPQVITREDTMARAHEVVVIIEMIIRGEDHIIVEDQGEDITHRVVATVMNVDTILRGTAVSAEDGATAMVEVDIMKGSIVPE